MPYPPPYREMLPLDEIALLERVQQRLGWSDSQLAFHLGRVVRTVNFWHTGRSRIAPEVVYWLQTVDFLLNEADRQNYQPPPEQAVQSSPADLLFTGGLIGLIVGLFLGGKK